MKLSALPQDAKKIMTVGAYSLYVDDSCSGPDVKKMEQYIYNQGTCKLHHVDHSPYELMSASAVVAHVRLGFPKREGSCAWRNQNIIERKREMA